MDEWSVKIPISPLRGGADASMRSAPGTPPTDDSTRYMNITVATSVECLQPPAGGSYRRYSYRSDTYAEITSIRNGSGGNGAENGPWLGLSNHDSRWGRCSCAVLKIGLEDIKEQSFFVQGWLEHHPILGNHRRYRSGSLGPLWDI